MPHILAEIDAAIDSMKGNATSGDLVDLRANVDAADNYVITHKPGDATGIALHEILNDIQAVLVDGDFSSMSSGMAATVTDWNSSIDGLL